MPLSLCETSPVVCVQDISKTSRCNFLKLSGIVDDNGRKVVRFRMSASLFITYSFDGSGAQRTEERRYLKPAFTGSRLSDHFTASTRLHSFILDR